MNGEFTVTVPGGELCGWEHGDGIAMLVLHGGPMTDYTAGLVPVLPEGARAVRYQQRGLPPSTTAEPYDVETHVADAIAVLDARGVERAWLLGHSWGGHLAFHVAVAHPGRVSGVIAVDALGAVPDGGWGDLDHNLTTRLAHDSPMKAERAAQLDERAMAGRATPAQLRESIELVWPYYFFDPSTAQPMPDEIQVSVALYSAVVASVRAHFERGTLEQGLPRLDVPFAFVHGAADPLPVRASEQTASLVSRSTIEVLEGCGHFPWLERPAEVTDAITRALFLAG